MQALILSIKFYFMIAKANLSIFLNYQSSDKNKAVFTLNIRTFCKVIDEVCK